MFKLFRPNPNPSFFNPAPDSNWIRIRNPPFGGRKQAFTHKSAFNCIFPGLPSYFGNMLIWQPWSVSSMVSFPGLRPDKTTFRRFDTLLTFSRHHLHLHHDETIVYDHIAEIQGKVPSVGSLD